MVLGCSKKKNPRRTFFQGLVLWRLSPPLSLFAILSRKSGFGLTDDDFDGVRQLMVQLFTNSSTVNISSLTNYLLSQSFIGTALKQSEVNYQIYYQFFYYCSYHLIFIPNTQYSQSLFNCETIWVCLMNGLFWGHRTRVYPEGKPLQLLRKTFHCNCIKVS